MQSLSLGPLALPVAPLLLFLAVWAASWLAQRLAARFNQGAQAQAMASAAGNAVLGAAALGLLAARLAHLLLNADFYAAAPALALDLRDGGWHAPTGAVAGLARLVWRGVAVPALWRPLAAAVVAGGTFWGVATVVTGVGELRFMPSVALTGLAPGAPVDLRQAAAGRPVVVNLWASWCGPCRQEMPMLAAAQQHSADVGFLFVNQGESAGAVQAYLTDQGLPLREVFLDAGSRLGAAVGSSGLPTTLFYDAQGRQVDAHVGVLNAAALQSRLRQLRRLQADQQALPNP